MKKGELEVGKNYGLIFGLDEGQGQKMVYNGGISWTAINGDLQLRDDNDQETTDLVLDNLFQMPDYDDGIKYGKRGWSYK